MPLAFLRFCFLCNLNLTDIIENNLKINKIHLNACRLLMISHLVTKTYRKTVVVMRKDYAFACPRDCKWKKGVQIAPTGETANSGR